MPFTEHLPDITDVRRYFGERLRSCSGPHVSPDPNVYTYWMMLDKVGYAYAYHVQSGSWYEVGRSAEELQAYLNLLRQTVARAGKL